MSIYNLFSGEIVYKFIYCGVFSFMECIFKSVSSRLSSELNSVLYCVKSAKKK